MSGVGSRNGIANCRWVVRTSSGSEDGFSALVAEKDLESPPPKQKKRNNNTLNRDAFIDFMNLSKSPYIDLIIDIGHLFPKIVLFRYKGI